MWRMRVWVVLLVLTGIFFISPACGDSTIATVSGGNDVVCTTCSACNDTGIASFTTLDVATVRANVDRVSRQIEAEGLSWTAGESPVTYMTEEAYQATLGLREDTPGMTTYNRGATDRAMVDAGTYPDSFTWRSNNGDWTTPVRNQGQCGSCWAFSIIGTFESYYERMMNNPNLNPDFSEQYLVSCNRDGYSCNGGYFSAFDLLVNEAGKMGGTGTVLESDYQYTATSGSCRDLSGITRYTVQDGTNWYYISGPSSIPTASLIKQTLVNNGPVSAAFYATDSFRYYRSGIYEEKKTYSGVNHAIVIVGWGHDSTKAKDYWICKNSWGSSWGDGGWFKIYTDQLNIGYGASYLSAPTPSENPAPSITSISPSAVTVGSAGFTLTVTGSGFVSSSKINWNGVERATTYTSPTQLSATIPASDLLNPGSITVTVVNPAPGGGVSNSYTITVKAQSYGKPVITKLNPTSATVYSPVFTLAVSGSGFGPASIVRWNGAELATTYKSATWLTAVVPSSHLTQTGTFAVTVENPAPGGLSDPWFFNVTEQINPVPVITRLSPLWVTQGSPDLILKVTGRRFVTGSQVVWGTTPLSTVYNSAGSLTAVVPARLLEFPGSVKLQVFNPAPGGGYSNRATFSIRRSASAPLISSISPRIMYAGTGRTANCVRVTGSRFTSESTAILSRDGFPSVTGIPYNVKNTRFNCEFTILLDPSYSGTWDLIVQNPNGLKSKKALQVSVQ